MAASLAPSEYRPGHRPDRMRSLITRFTSWACGHDSGGMAFQVGDLLGHRVNPELGPGRVEVLDGRRVTLFFRRSQSRLTFNASDEALAPISLGPGDPASLEPGPEPVVIAQRLDATRFRLADGREVEAGRLWPAERPSGAEERLAALDVDTAGHFLNRLDALVLERERQAGGLGSFLGGRIQIFPHQLHVAERAVASDPVRWLLADEVGLGKTVEACLILARLLRTGRAERALVVAPGTLTVQWLSELWRKFHQVFVLLDSARRADVVRELGKGFNPFEAHARMVVAIEELVADPALAAKARRRRSTCSWSTRPIAWSVAADTPAAPPTARWRPSPPAHGTSLLLSATPLEADVHGFFRLLELLRPEAYASEDAFTAALAEGRPLPPCTSATRRVDIGGIPPRRPQPVDLEEPLPRAGLSGL